MLHVVFKLVYCTDGTARFFTLVLVLLILSLGLLLPIRWDGAVSFAFQILLGPTSSSLCITFPPLCIREASVCCMFRQPVVLGFLGPVPLVVCRVLGRFVPSF